MYLWIIFLAGQTIPKSINNIHGGIDLKISIYKNYLCDYERLKMLPKQYYDLIKPSLYGQRITLVCFPYGKEPIMSGEVKKL